MAQCPLCGRQSDLLADRGRGGAPMRNLLCRACGLIFRDPGELEPDGAAGLYAQGDYARMHEWPEFAGPGKYLSKYARRLLPLFAQCGMDLKGKSVLDVGFGQGTTLYDWRLTGAEVNGVEPMPQYREAALAAGFEAWPDLADVPSDRRYDVIHLRDVFEHLAEPVKFLTGCRNLLSSNGMLILRTPNSARPWTHRRHPCDWFDPGHLFTYAPWHVSHLLGRAGYEPCAQDADTDIYAAARPGGAKGRSLPDRGEEIRRAYELFARWHWLKRPAWRLGKLAGHWKYYASATLRRLGLFRPERSD